MKDITKEALDNWAETGIPKGGFVMAVLENNLMAAVISADTTNLKDLAEIVRYVYNHLPSECWGSKEKVKNYRSLIDAKKVEANK